MIADEPIIRTRAPLSEPFERVTCVFVQLDNQPGCAARVVILTTGATQSIPCETIKEANELRDQLFSMPVGLGAVFSAPIPDVVAASSEPDLWPNLRDVVWGERT
jgi:hypothetical protein